MSLIAPISAIGKPALTSDLWALVSEPYSAVLGLAPNT
jgi:hypothetical protein